jgi:HemY protein
MIRIILFLFVIGLIAIGAALVADQTGDVVLSWNVWRVETSLPVLALALLVVIAAALLLWAIVRGVLRAPGQVRRLQHARRERKARAAITQGLIAIGTGDSFAARRHADVARRLAHHDPLAMLLEAQSAQLNGDSNAAHRAFYAMAERKDTRLLGLRGLFVEAQRRDDPLAAAALAEEALKSAPACAWASHAVLGFRCSQGDWDGALRILENDLAAGLIEPVAYKRQRGVLLTARALDLEASDRDASRASVTEAVKLAPTLVPAATLAAKYLSESNQIRRAMRLLETAWAAEPHPDLADAYAHVRLGDAALERLARVEKLAAMAPDHLESALALGRAAIDAGEFARAREALQPFVAAPTQRVAILMAELERAEHGDAGRARQWMLRAVRAALDPAWTADGYVSDRWRPVSPVTGRIDAFRWLTPVASLPSDTAPVLEPLPTDELGLPSPELSPVTAELPPPHEGGGDDAPAAVAVEPEQPEQPEEADEANEAEKEVSPAAAPPAAAVADAAPAVFRPRREIAKADAERAAPVIPILRAPDDPGVADDGSGRGFDDPERPDDVQPGGWKGFLSRLSS